MPIHDWSKFDDGIFHNQQLGWAVTISGMLNTGLLPKGYYSLVRSMDFVEPVVDDEDPPEPPDLYSLPGIYDARDVPPHVRFTGEVSDVYVQKRKRVRIHRECDDEVVAVIEILSPGNKANRPALDAIVKLITDELRQERQVLVLDINKPTRCAPQGIHPAIFEEFGNDASSAPTDKPCSLAAYTSGFEIKAYVEPVGLGEQLPPMPLFLDSRHYLMLPLEETYIKAFSGMPRHLQTELNATIDKK